jgi:hypothetical protein
MIELAAAAGAIFVWSQPKFRDNQSPGPSNMRPVFLFVRAANKPASSKHLFLQSCCALFVASEPGLVSGLDPPMSVGRWHLKGSHGNF